jgi:hypothetical protein
MDPRGLNKAIQRYYFQLKTIEEVIADMPQAQVFSKIDTKSSFWQLKLTKESSRLCTFNTPFGIYRFKRLPFGIVNASEVFQKAVSEMIEDIEGAVSIIDDILIWGKDMQEHDERLKRVLDRVRESKMKLSSDNCQFRRNQVSYVGHVLTSEGVKPNPEKVRAVEAMSPSENKSELLTFLGFINYNVPNEIHIAYVRSKRTSQTIIAREEHIMALGRTTAIKFSKTQNYDYKCSHSSVLRSKVTVARNSISTFSDAKRRWKQITNHYRRFSETPPRLQRLLLTLQKYDLHVEYKQGKLMYLADHLSRNYIEETKENLVPDLSVNELNLLAYLPISEQMYSRFQKATSEDDELQEVIAEQKNGRQLNICFRKE